MASLLEALAAYGNQGQGQQQGWGQVVQGLSGLAQQQNPALQHLSALAGARPQVYAPAYASALAQLADPDRRLNNQFRQAQIQSLQNPQVSFSDQLALMKLQQEQQGRNNNLELLGVPSPLGQFTQPTANVQGPPMSALGGFTNPSAPLNERNNNPGNLKDPRTGEFKQFSSVEDGIAANLADLQLKLAGDSPAMKAKLGDNYVPNLKNLISVWAPKSDNNNPDQYANFVSQKTGIPIDQPLTPEDAARILPAMAQMEGSPLPQSALESLTQPTATSSMTQPMTNAVTMPDFGAQAQAVENLRRLAANNPTDANTANFVKAQADLAKEQRDAVLKAQESSGKSKKDLAEGESAIRKEFETLPDVKQYREVESSYRRIEKAAEKPTPAGDLALIFNYMKMLDPGSTVREGEFANAANAAPLLTRLGVDFNKVEGVWKGNKLTPEQRQDFVTQAFGQYQGAQELFQERASQYETVASQYGFDPKRVIQGSRGSVKAPALAGLTTPSIQDLMAEKARRIR